MNTKKDLEIEFKSNRLYPLNERYIYYRIKPKQLKFFQRLFNPWRQLYKAFDNISGYQVMFTVQEYYEYFRSLKTYGDVRNFLDEQNKKMFKIKQLTNNWPI